MGPDLDGETADSHDRFQRGSGGRGTQQAVYPSMADAADYTWRFAWDPVARHVSVHAAVVLQLIRAVRVSRADAPVAVAAAGGAVPADPDLRAHQEWARSCAGATGVRGRFACRDRPALRERACRPTFPQHPRRQPD